MAVMRQSNAYSFSTLAVCHTYNHRRGRDATEPVLLRHAEAILTKTPRLGHIRAEIEDMSQQGMLGRRYPSSEESQDIFRVHAVQSGSTIRIQHAPCLGEVWNL